MGFHSPPEPKWEQAASKSPPLAPLKTTVMPGEYRMTSNKRYGELCPVLKHYAKLLMVQDLTYTNTIQRFVEHIYYCLEWYMMRKTERAFSGFSLLND